MVSIPPPCFQPFESNSDFTSVVLLKSDVAVPELTESESPAEFESVFQPPVSIISSEVPLDHGVAVR